ncbi:MAG: hypothetical protein ABIP51_07405 [Bacteroidia bacterium]
MIDINNKEKVFATIDKFSEEMTPLFGKLTPQHVLEHLLTSINLSTGKRQIEFFQTQEMADRFKAKLVYTDAEIPQGIKNPLLTDDLPELKYHSLDEAKQKLKAELEYFYEYRSQNPNAMGTHPRLNSLTMSEWTTMHTKHFSHHFKQYGLL